MGKKVIRQYTNEFIEQALSLALQGDQAVSTTAEDLGVSSSTLHGWIRRRRQGKLSLTGSRRSPESAAHAQDTKFRELEAQVRRLTMERDILKKAMAYCVDVPM